MGCYEGDVGQCGVGCVLGVEVFFVVGVVQVGGEFEVGCDGVFYVVEGGLGFGFLVLYGVVVLWVVG